MTRPQIITSPSGEELVVVPRSEYEDLVDALAARKVEAALAAGREELLTAEEAAALLAAPTPLAFWRKKRDKTQAQLAAEIGGLEHRQGVHYPGYDQWIAAGLNNAQLASVATYYHCMPGFKRLLAEQGDDLARFYAAARELGREPRELRHAKLCESAPLLPQAAAPPADGARGRALP